ncbi:DUF6911 family protein [Achromobacter ruhlandii]|uniref:DUF6911 family protein n=1 Tax=Achromobacter ruhlandii TaxID=72557 RepID=UPI003B97EAF1
MCKGAAWRACGEIGSIAEIWTAKLRLYAEEFNYPLMLGEYSDNGDYVVRTLRTSSAATFKAIFGEPYPPAAITTYFLLVCQIFKGFGERHDVSKEMMLE